MKQKVSIARTIVHDPPVLIFDEPTVGLDVLNALEMQKVIAELRGEGKTIIFSTHIMSEAERLCDRIAIIHRGRIHACDTLDALRERDRQALPRRHLHPLRRAGQRSRGTAPSLMTPTARRIRTLLSDRAAHAPARPADGRDVPGAAAARDADHAVRGALDGGASRATAGGRASTPTRSPARAPTKRGRWSQRAVQRIRRTETDATPTFREVTHRRCSRRPAIG